MINSDDFVSKINNCAKKWNEETKNHSRYLSWEYCYESFYNAFSDFKSLTPEKYLYLSLQLAFYLASWGMYRGSSFLLHYDYKIHLSIVKLILQENYKSLLGIYWDNTKEDYEANLNKLFNEKDVLVTKIKKHYIKYRNGIQKNVENKNNYQAISDILVTKILLGTLGCIPAYDRYLKVGIGESNKYGNNFLRNFGKKSFELLVTFYANNKNILEKQRNNLKLNNSKLNYPQMKFLDMGLWKLGFEKTNEDGK